jgi:replication factor A1
MTIDEIVDSIVEKKSLSRKQVFDLIEKKKGNLNWMISDEGAAEIVARELGVEACQDPSDDDLTLTIADLVAGMSNVMITGRITGIKQAKEFNDKSGGKSVVASLTVSDRSGEMRVVLWGEAAKPVQDNDIDTGAIVRIHNGYVREDLSGKPELHVGKKGYLEVNPTDVDKNDFPENSREFTNINQLTTSVTRVNVAGVVSAVYGTKLIKTREGKETKLSSLVISDGIGASVRIVFWDDSTSLTENVKKGNTVEITSGRVRLTRNKDIEVHIDSTSTFNVRETSEGVDNEGTDKLHKISEITQDLNVFSTRGVVTEEPRFREFTRSDGTTGKILSFNISDNSSSIRIVVWGEHAEKLRNLRKGFTIVVKRAKLKVGVKGDLEGHINYADSVEISCKDRLDTGIEHPVQGSSPTEIGHQSIPRRRICELKDGEPAEIRGIITKVNSNSPVYMACPKCLHKVEKIGGAWLCPKDGNVPKPAARVLYSVTLDDGNDTVVCTLSGSPGEDLLEMKHNREISESEIELFRKSNFANILGLDIVFDGKYCQNQRLNRREFRVNRIFRPDPRLEAKMLLEQIKNDFAS